MMFVSAAIYFFSERNDEIVGLHCDALICIVAWHG